MRSLRLLLLSLPVLGVAPLAALVSTVATTPAFAQDVPEITCNIKQYSPGATYSDFLIRSWIPESFIIDLKPGGEGFRFEGGNFREPLAKIEEVSQTGKRVLYKMIVNARDTRGNYISLRYNIFFFTSSKRVSVETSSGGEYSRLGSASGTCVVL